MKLNKTYIMVTALLTLATGLSSSAKAKMPSDQLRVSFSIGQSGEFRKINNQKVSTFGPEIAIQLPVGKFRGLDLTLEPTYFGGGRLFSGGDSDQDVYRLMLLGRSKSIGGTYFTAGFGLAHGVDRANQVDSAAGFIGKIGIGYSGLSFGKMTARYKPSLEANLYLAESTQLSGFFVGLTAGF